MLQCCTLFWALIVFFLSGSGARGDEEIPSEETPRLERDQEDEWWFHFMTRPDIQAPKYEVHIYDEDALAPGYWFIAPYQNINKLKRGNPWEGPYIYDGHGELIWAGTPQMDYYMVNDFKVQKWNNTDMITGIMFRDNAAFFLNEHYEAVKQVSWTSKWEYANMHEFHVVRDSTRALTVTRNRKTHMSLEESRTVNYEGNCIVKADGFMEVDITVEPPQVLFEWIGTDHIPLAESLHKVDKKQHSNVTAMAEICESDWDIHHFNSVDKFADGDYLLSSKVLDTIFKISHVDGSIVWRLGGMEPRVESDFKMCSGCKFGDQHIPRIINESDTHVTISMFANTTPKRSRGQVIRVDYNTKTTELLQEAHDLINKEQPDVNSRGSSQLLDNSNMLTCWANWARLSEHDVHGNLLMFSHLKWDYDRRPKGNHSPTYRGFKFQWTGRPKSPPDVYSAAFQAGTENFVTRVFVSWNGATEVARWKFYESNEDGSSLIEIANHKKKHFETDKRFEHFVPFVVLEALDDDDNSIGRSAVVKTIPPAEGAPLALNHTTNILTCDTSSAAGSDKADLEADYDWDGEPQHNDLTDSYDVLDAADSWTLLSLDPTSVLFGFSSCAAMWMVISMFGGRFSCRRSRGIKYEPLATKDTYIPFSDKRDEQSEADVELKER